MVGIVPVHQSPPPTTTTILLSIPHNNLHFSPIRIFDAATAAESTDIRSTRYKIGKRKSGLSGLISCVAFSPRQPDLFCAGSFSSQFIVGDVRTQAKSVSFVQQAHKRGAGGGGLTHMQWSHCGRYIYSAARKDGAIKVWDLRMTERWDGSYREAAVLDTPLMGRDVPTNQRISFDLDMSGQYLYSGCNSGVVRVFEVPSGRPVTTLPIARGSSAGDSTSVSSVACHPSLPLFAATTGERKFKIDSARCAETRCFTRWEGGSVELNSVSDSDSSSDSSDSSDSESKEEVAEEKMEDNEEEKGEEPVKIESMSATRDSIFGDVVCGFVAYAGVVFFCS